MRKGKNLSKIAVCALIAIAFFATGSIVGGDFKAGKEMEIFFNILKTINLEYVDTIDNQKIVRKATDAMLATLDPYTVYLDEKDMEDFTLSTTGKYAGVGSLVKPSVNGGYASISTIYEGFPMHKAGVTPGDSIVAIDGEDMKGLASSIITGKMKGTAGTVVNMTMKKLRTGEIITYPVTREVIRISPIDYYGFINDSIGYISYNNFSSDSAKEVENAIKEMKATGNLKGLILDLRSNGGGFVTEAVKIVGMFVPKGSTVVSMKGRYGEDDQVYRTHTNPIDTELPITVLINNSSASASEIVAGALQDMDRAYIIGQRSFGKGLVQTTRPVGYDTYAKLTIAKYYTPSGRCIQALDYTHRNDDGSVSHVPDSLISEFKSVGGRILYDGGGIMPDSVTEPEYISLFTASVVHRNFIEDFATSYYEKNKKIASPREFKISDKDYKDFVNYVKDKKIEFKSKSEAIIEDLEKSAEKDKHLEEITEEIESIKKKLTARDNIKSLEENQEEISKIIESEIVSKFYFPSGRMENVAINDELIYTAIDILNDKEHYNYVIKNKSPRKN